MLLTALLLMAAATPAPGVWKIENDVVNITRERWSIFCDERAVVVKPTGNGAELDVSLDGAEWRARGAARNFGSRVCEGRNKRLAAFDRKTTGNAIVLDCRSEAVTLGTESGKQSLTVDEKRISVQVDMTQQFKANGDDCVSRMNRTTSLSFVRAKDAPKIDAPEVVAEKPIDPCATPGVVVALSIEPRHVVAKVGDPPACFSVKATDKNGCAAPVVDVNFSLDPEGVGAVNAEGCYTPAKLDEETAIAVIARVGKVESAASVQIVPTGEGRATKSLETLAKTTKSTRVKQILAEVTRGELVVRPLETTPPPLPPLDDASVPWGTVGGAGLAFLIGTGGVLFLRRRRRDESATELQAVPVVVPTKGGGLVCPKCQFEFAKGEATICPFDATPLNDLDRDARQTMFIPVAGGMICPTCQTKYPTKARFCGHDGSPLLPDFGGGL